MTRIAMSALGFVLLVWGAVSWAQPVPLDFGAQRASIDQARQLAETRFKEEETACYQRFAVNDCVLAARSRLRAVQTEVRHRRNALNDLERQNKANESRARQTP